MRKRKIRSSTRVFYRKRVPPLSYPSNAPPIFIRKQDPIKRRHRNSQRFTKESIRRLLLGVLLLGVIIGCAFLLNLWRQNRQLPKIATPPSALFTYELTLQEPPLPLLDKVILVHTVKKGETLGSIIARYGIGKDLERELTDTMQRIATQENVSLALRIKQDLVFGFDVDGTLHSLKSDFNNEKTLEVSRNEAGSFVGTLQTKVVERREHVVVGSIQTSFAQAAIDAGLSYSVIDELVDLFSDRVLFREDFRVGDRFTIIYDNHAFKEDAPLTTGIILAAAIEVKGKRFASIRYVGSDGKARYFNELSEPLGASFLRYPVKFSRVTSTFSKARFHPILQRWRPHNGIDFAAPTGTPVRSVADGRVVFAGRDGGNGIMIKLKHSGRYETAYLHLSKIEKGVVRGAPVSRGQIIGAVGATGLATGPHLHFSLFDQGKYVDPLGVKLPVSELLDKGQKISANYLRKVLFTLDRYQAFDLETFYKS